MSFKSSSIADKKHIFYVCWIECSTLDQLGLPDLQDPLIHLVIFHLKDNNHNKSILTTK